MSKFNKDYFERYQQKNIFGLEKGRRPFLYKFWIRKLKKLLPIGSKIVDVGCGPGYFLQVVDKYKYFDTYGLDCSQDALKLATVRTNAKLFLGEAESLPFKNEYFSAVIAFDVIEHLKMPENFLNEAFRVLKDNGCLIVTTPNPSSLGAKLKSKNWYGVSDVTHINIRSIDMWRKCILEKEFVIIRCGTDTLWDVPYFKIIPLFIQKLIFISLHWVLTYLFGFFPWKLGENCVFIAKKKHGNEE